jgi:hypothetical protein
LITGQWQLCRVTETYVFEHRGDLVTISVGGETIESTYHHPYWVVEGPHFDRRPIPDHLVSAEVKGATVPGRWVDAGDLWVGDIVLLMGGRRLPVDDVAVRYVEQSVYNFAVNQLQCYAVGKLAVLAHNMCADAANKFLRDVDITRLRYPPDRQFADSAKLAAHGAWDWSKYTPIIVESDRFGLTIQEGVTRVENALRSNITKLPAYVFPKS